MQRLSQESTGRVQTWTDNFNALQGKLGQEAQAWQTRADTLEREARDDRARLQKSLEEIADCQATLVKTVTAMEEHFKLESESEVEEEEAHDLTGTPPLTILPTVDLSPLPLGGSVCDSVMSLVAKDIDPKGKMSAPLIPSDPKFFVGRTIDTGPKQAEGS